LYPADVPCGETTPSDDEKNDVEYTYIVVKRKESKKKNVYINKYLRNIL
jgi:hypothetical protein